MKRERNKRCKSRQKHDERELTMDRGILRTHVQVFEMADTVCKGDGVIYLGKPIGSLALAW